MVGESRRKLVVLVGPKGAGKTHLGRLLEGLHLAGFVDVEPIVLRALERCRAEGTPYASQGFDAIEHALVQAFQKQPVLAMELTGASPGCPTFLARMRDHADVVLVRVEAPEELCQARIASRDASRQIPVSAEVTRHINEASRALAWPWDATLSNVEADDSSTRRMLLETARAWTSR